MNADVLSITNPTEYEQRRKDGYVAELPDTAPAVIMFTSAPAGGSIAGMLHRFTGYMGTDRKSTEVIYRFDESKISTNSKTANEDCWCSQRESWDAGDRDPLLDLAWIGAD
jgi:hypothetical protein